VSCGGRGKRRDRRRNESGGSRITRGNERLGPCGGGTLSSPIFASYRLAATMGEPMARIRLLAVVLVMLPTSAFAQGSSLSANTILPGCQALAGGNTPESPTVTFFAGKCAGYLEMLLVARILSNGQWGACVPVGVNTRQAAKVVVAYVEQRPQLLHEPLGVLADQAIRAAWPCR
jgi:hypothetical protein